MAEPLALSTFNPLLAAILIGLIGILLWVVTNWHLVRTGKAIKADIDQKRAATEKFVQDELKLLKRGLREDLEAPDTGALKGEVQELRQHLEKLDEALGGHFQAIHEVVEKLPERVRMAAISTKGVEMREVYAKATEAGEEVEQYVADNMDPVDIALAKVDSIEIKDAYREKNPLGALIAEGGKAWLMANLGERRGGGVVNMKRLRRGQGGEGSVYG